MNTSILASERAVTYSIAAGDVVYRVAVARTSLALSRPLGNGQVLVASVNAIGDKASCELDLRPWPISLHSAMHDEVSSVIASLAGKGVTPEAHALIGTLTDYLSRLQVTRA